MIFELILFGVNVWSDKVKSEICHLKFLISNVVFFKKFENNVKLCHELSNVKLCHLSDVVLSKSRVDILTLQEGGRLLMTSQKFFFFFDPPSCYAY